jgi:hypothetical protein
LVIYLVLFPSISITFGDSMLTTGLVPAKEEVSFYSDTEGVQVTNSRLIIASTTYAMLNITSVSCAFEKTPRGGPMSFILLGVSSFIAGLAASSPMFIVFGVPMLLIGGYWWKVQKIKYHLLL